MRLQVIVVALGAMSAGALADPTWSTSSTYGVFGVGKSGTPSTGVVEIDEYQQHQGPANGQLGLTSGGHLVWIMGYNAQAGFETLTHVNAAIGGDPAAGGNGLATALLGQTLHVYVWDDPNNDGNPTDGVLLSQGSGTITNVINSMLNRIAIPNTNVSGRFFIGASVAHIAGEFPAARDTGTPSGGNAWVTGNSTSTYDPNTVAGSIGLFEMSQIGFDSSFLLTASAIPAPGAATLFGLGGLVALRRRR